MSQPVPANVDFVVNVFERTYRRALAPGALAALAAQQRFPFVRRVVLINNTVDAVDAERRAQRLLDAGEIDAYYRVADHLQQALGLTGLRREELEPLLHYSDGPLVAATLPGSPWFLYWDPEARLAQPLDWITPALKLIDEDIRVIVANPSWEPPNPDGLRPGVEREAIFMRDGFAVGHGFSDQVFLARRAVLASPIYSQRCIVSITYPGAHKATVFEARVGAHMRHHGGLRATSLATTYVTDQDEGSSSYPPSGVVETGRLLINALTLRALRASPWRPSCLRHSWL
jgi:hypothetical protein